MILEWVDKKDGDYIDPNDINKVAKGVQSLEKLIDDTKSSSVQNTKNGSSIYATNEKGEATTVRYAPNAEADTVAYRDENGNIGVGSPVQEQDATNKQYVDRVRVGLENSVANALKGSVSGEAVRVDDVSPLAHDMVVKVSGVEDVSVVKVQRLGKNLFDVSKVKSYAPGGVDASLKNNKDGSITIILGSISSTSGGPPSTLGDYAPGLKAGETYTLSANTTGSQNHIYLYETKESWIFGRSKVITEEMLGSKVNWYASGFHSTATISNIQIEIGKNATEYETYIDPTEYTPNADGTVDGVTALFPTTTLTTDTAGAIIECEYNRDINKAFAELQQAIISMGGNV